MNTPPGNLLDADQNESVANTGADLVEGLTDLLDRIRGELGYNDAKGKSPFRLGVHDGLRFAEEAIAQVLCSHGHHVVVQQRETDA